MIRTCALLTLVITLLAPAVATAGQITVFAAASLRGPLEDIAAQSDTNLRLSFGGSGTMARQVAAGAPADVVILANTLWMDWLTGQNINGFSGPTQVASNRLVVIGPLSAPRLATPEEIGARLGTGRLAMGQRDGVPAGSYARQWLTYAGLWDALNQRLAETDNVRAALALVARGDVPLGIVYATDALAEPAVQVVYAIAPETHDPIGYFAASLTPAGAAFIDELTTRTALFTAHGFTPVPE